MASNEAIQNLATLLGALKDFNEPRREMEQYTKKALLNFKLEKDMALYKYNLNEAEEVKKFKKEDKLLNYVQTEKLKKEGYDPERASDILKSGEDVDVTSPTGKDLTAIPGKGPVYGRMGFRQGYKETSRDRPDIYMQSDKVPHHLTRRALYDLNETFNQYVEILGEEVGALTPGSSRYEQFETDKNNMIETLNTIGSSGHAQEFNNYEVEVYNNLLDKLGS